MLTAEEIEKQLRSDAEVVPDTPAPALESEPEEQPRPFPEIAWAGLFGQWREVVAPCTEAEIDRLQGARLSVVVRLMGERHELIRRT